MCLSTCVFVKIMKFMAYCIHDGSFSSIPYVYTYTSTVEVRWCEWAALGMAVEMEKRLELQFPQFNLHKTAWEYAGFHCNVFAAALYMLWTFGVRAWLHLNIHARSTNTSLHNNALINMETPCCGDALKYG